MSSRVRHSLNVVGDFYVEAGCCTLCGVPAVTAPELFGGFDATGGLAAGTEHCWVKKQPQSAAELDAMIETLETQDTACIRYCGSDPAVLPRIPEDSLDT